MAESLILPNSTFSANNITATGNVVISSALYLGTTSLQVSASTGGVNANVYSGGSLVRQGYAPTYIESSTAPALAAEGDKWWSTSNSTPFRYLSGGWRKLVASTVLYTFTTATFNTGGATGQNGPTLSQARSGLTGTPTPSDWYSTYLDMTTQGIMLWTVPATGSYTITAAGAGGASAGNGRVVSITISLTRGNVIKILVGQKGITPYAGQGGGGGGGSFVCNSDNSIIAIAGGAGGNGTDATTSDPAGNGCYESPPQGMGGSGGNGGTCGTDGPGGSGAGYSGNGNACGVSSPANSFLNGGVGGVGGGGFNGADGGFGGGGGGFLNNTSGPFLRSGGGGGYSGGGGGSYCGGYGTGGGGSPYLSVAGSGLNYNVGGNSGAGYVTITKI